MFPESISAETPALVIHEGLALRNIRRFQTHCDDVGLRLRPHVKTHKSVRFAKAQMDAGAVGLTCQKVSEAEVMAAAGFSDILITYNILGDAKLGRLRALAQRTASLSVVSDNESVADVLSKTFETVERPLTVLVECDTGGGRCGVRTPQAASALARRISSLPGLKFGGLMTYPAPGGQASVAEFMAAAKAETETHGVNCETITSGGSPDMWDAWSHDGLITEYRAGTYIYNDRSLVERGACAAGDCAARVYATVVSVPAENRAVMDAGSKILTSDLLGLDGHGHIVDHPAARIVSLSEEHGVIHFGRGAGFSVGDQVAIIPNHICVVANMVDEAWLIKEHGEMSTLTIDARGTVT